MLDRVATDASSHFAVPASNYRARFWGLVGCLCLFAALTAPSSRAQTSVLTQHNDNARTGQNINESVLNTSNVKTGSFGKLFALTVTGQVYAQPLYVPSVSIAGGTHNVLIVATEADMVYAFDADSNTGANSSPLWSASMVDAAHGAGSGETPLNSSTTIGCTDLQPQIGITSTPAIDAAGQTIYAEAKSTVNGTYIHRLHALSLTTGAEKAPGPVVISATVNGTGDGSSNGKLSFDSLHQQNRPGLLLLNGAIYLVFASHCDFGPYHGWIFAYDAATFAQKSLLVTSPNGGLGGFWMSGSGVAADSSGNIYIATGNGDFNNASNPIEFGDSIIKLGTTNESLTLLDYFTPSDQQCLNNNDTDLGSGGVLLLPDQPGATPHLLVEAGKEGMVYVINRDQLTTNNSHYHPVNSCTSTDPEILEENRAVGGMWSMPAYWNNNIYFWASGDVLKSIPITNGLPDFTHITSNSTSYGFPGATPSISSNGAAAGTAIVWSIDSSQYGSPGPGPGPAVIHAHDATNISKELWNSSQAVGDKAGNAVKFSVPTIANGKVYIGTSTEVDVYGLTGGGTITTATPVITPGSETVSKPVNVNMTDSTPGATIYYTTDGSTPTVNSTPFTKAFMVTSTTTVKAIAAAPGDLNSAVASVTYTIESAVATPQFSPAPGNYTGSVTVSISDATSGAAIFFTTDGSKPVPGQGTTQQYVKPFTLTKAALVKAVATNGAATSAVETGAYKVKP